MKQCSKCNISKIKTLFSKNTRQKDGLQSFCKDCARVAKNQWYLNNKDKELAKIKLYQTKNKDHLAQKHNEYLINRKNIDTNFKLACNLRTRLSCAIKNGGSVRYLGCSLEHLKAYLESKFQSGMNWDNYGQFGWHIDHIKPLANFNLTEEDQLKIACHYTNLQPLWWQDNLKKGNH